MAKTYEQGMIDAIQKYGKVCDKYIKRKCDGCPLEYASRGTTGCIQLAKESPEKFLSELKQADNSHTYSDEFRFRYPASGLSTEELVTLGMCRKIIFDGYFECENYGNENGTEECVLCWEQLYKGVDGIIEEEPKKKDDENPFG